MTEMSNMNANTNIWFENGILQLITFLFVFLIAGYISHAHPVICVTFAAEQLRRTEKRDQT